MSKGVDVDELEDSETGDIGDEEEDTEVPKNNTLISEKMDTVLWSEVVNKHSRKKQAPLKDGFCIPTSNRFSTIGTHENFSDCDHKVEILEDKERNKDTVKSKEKKSYLGGIGKKHRMTLNEKKSNKINHEIVKSVKRKCRKCGYKKNCKGKESCQASISICSFCSKPGHCPKSIDCTKKRKLKRRIETRLFYTCQTLRDFLASNKVNVHSRTYNRLKIVQKRSIAKETSNQHEESKQNLNQDLVKKICQRIACIIYEANLKKKFENSSKETRFFYGIYLMLNLPYLLTESIDLNHEFNDINKRDINVDPPQSIKKFLQISQNTTYCLENVVQIDKRFQKANNWNTKELENQEEINQVEKNIEKYTIELTRQLGKVDGHNERQELLNRVKETPIIAAKPLHITPKLLGNNYKVHKSESNRISITHIYENKSMEPPQVGLNSLLKKIGSKKPEGEIEGNIQNQVHQNIPELNIFHSTSEPIKDYSQQYSNNFKSLSSSCSDKIYQVGAIKGGIGHFPA